MIPSIKFDSNAVDLLHWKTRRHEDSLLFYTFVFIYSVNENIDMSTEHSIPLHRVAGVLRMCGPDIFNSYIKCSVLVAFALKKGHL